jgi:hypothetical protein
MSKSPPKIKKFSAVKQRRMDLLLDKNSEGAASAAEKEELKDLVKEAEELMVENYKRLAEYMKSNGGAPSSNAVPVTVWVAERQTVES